MNVTCKICGKEYKGIGWLRNHIVNDHNMSLVDYNDNYEVHPSEQDKLCPVCGKPKEATWDGYRRETCGNPDCYRTLHPYKNARNPNPNPNRSEAMRRKWADPEYRDRISRKYKEFWNSEEGKETSKARNQSRKENPGTRDLCRTHSEQMREVHKAQRTNSFESYQKWRDGMEKTYNGTVPLSSGYLYLFKNEFGLKVGVSVRPWVRQKETSTEVLIEVKLPTVCAARYENILLCKYYNSLLIVNNSKSEWIHLSQEQHLKEDFNEIKNHTFRMPL